METSDSDIESECFESAEESLDENEEKNETSKLKKNLRNSEDETTASISDTAESICQAAEDVFINSFSYRKRPEKSKRLSSKTAVKPISRSSSNEIILKSDMIMPDVFFHDITNNLSKNINKSLNTIQQKSSNVKDLILSSLPGSTSVNNEGFSYDDKNNSTKIDNESELLSIKSESEENIPSEKSFETNNTDTKNSNVKIEMSKIKTFTTETNNLPTHRLNAKSKEKSESPGKEENYSFEHTTASEIIESKENISKETEDFILPVFKCLDLGQLDYIKKDSHTVNVPKIKEDIKNFIETYPLNCENPKILCDQHQEIINEDNSSTQSVNNLENMLKACTSDENIDLKNNDNNKGLIKNDEVIPFSVKKNEVNVEFSFSELKNALENIVNEEITSGKSNNTEEECLKEKNVEINEISNEGWDDFDFSDSEVECEKFSQPSEGKNLDEKEENINKNLVMEADKEMSKDLDSDQDVLKENLSVTKKPSEKVSVSFVKNKNSVFQDKSSHKDENNKTKEFVEYLKNKSESDEVWDWDNWDETPNDKDKGMVPSTENSVIKDIEKSDLDVSEWSGWDTFAQKPQEKPGNWSFRSWGVDVLLNKATAVTQGISSVLEASLGAPDPETLARMEIENKKAQKQVEFDNDECLTEISKKNSITNVNIFPVSGITNLVAGVTSKIVEHSKIQEIGSKVITGGLDTLETFGKKTMEVLQEGDPGLKNKRALLLGNNKPVLSQVLKEAREKANTEMRKAEEKEWARKCHFETLFDDFQGMVHLEALEMVSRQCELKLDQIKSEKSSDEQEHLKELLEEIQQLCSLDECDIDVKFSVLDFKTALQMAVKPLKNEISVEKMIKIHEDVSSWLLMSSETKLSFTILYQKLVSTLAELTAATVHQFHKGGELLSVGQCRMTLQEVDGLSSLTNVLCKEINQLCDKFFLLSCNGNSSGNDNPDSVKKKITEVRENSTSYIKQAFDLLIPVIQLGAVSS